MTIIYQKYLKRFLIYTKGDKREYAYNLTEAQVINEDRGTRPKVKTGCKRAPRKPKPIEIKVGRGIRVPCGVMRRADSGRCEPGDKCPHYQVDGGCLDKSIEVKYAGWKI